MRELEIIGEAIKHILDDPIFSTLVNNNWRKIVDFRNVLAHEYFGVDLNAVFAVTTESIHIFELEFIDFILMAHDDVFFAALSAAKEEVKMDGWQDSVQYLESIEKLVRNFPTEL